MVVSSDKGVEFRQQEEEEVDDDEIMVAGSFTAAAGKFHDHGFSPMKEE